MIIGIIVGILCLIAAIIYGACSEAARMH